MRRLLYYLSNGAVAHSGERFNGIEEVEGSIPSSSTTFPLLLFQDVPPHACVLYLNRHFRWTVTSILVHPIPRLMWELRRPFRHDPSYAPASHHPSNTFENTLLV